MSLRKRPTLTPKLLAANAENAKKSTGPRTRRGRAFSKLNGWKGGRPRNSSYPFPVSEDWQPDMSDPSFVTWMLTEMRDEYPEAFAIWMRCSPEHRQLLREKEGAANEADPKGRGPQEVSDHKANNVDNK